jgi:hypothetical protein
VLNDNADRIDYFVADSEILTYITGDSQGKPQGIDPSSPDKLKWKDKLKDLYSTGLDVATSGQLLMKAFFNSQKVATFKTTDHNQPFEIDIFQVIHQTPLPQANTAPTQPDTVATQVNTAGPMPVDWRTIIG